MAHEVPLPSPGRPDAWAVRACLVRSAARVPAGTRLGLSYALRRLHGGVRGAVRYDACEACSARRPEVSVDSVVLLLNADYEPLNVCDLRRAFRLVFGEKAEVI